MGRDPCRPSRAWSRPPRTPAHSPRPWPSITSRFYCTHRTQYVLGWARTANSVSTLGDQVMPPANTDAALVSGRNAGPGVSTPPGNPARLGRRLQAVLLVVVIADVLDLMDT